MNNKPNEVTMFFIRTLVTIGMAAVAAYLTTQISVAKLELRMKNVEKSTEDFRQVDRSVTEIKRDIKHISVSIERIERKIERNADG